MGRNNEGCGCLGQILVMGFFLIIGLCVDLYNNSQYGMMNDARDYKSGDKYLDYLLKYPEGRYVEEAEDSIVAIMSRDKNITWIYRNIDKFSKDVVCGRLADISYNQTLSANTLDDWLEYIENIPANYHRDASSKIDSIKEANAKKEEKFWGTEKQAWKTACKNDTYESYLKYLQLYPSGIHKSKANKKIIDFEVAHDFAGEHGEMPTMDRTEYGSGSFSIVTVTNQTSYEMTLLYSGNTRSERLVINSYGTKSVKLPNDSYRISARVNASNVIPYVGTETLAGGNYSASYYISSN